MFSYKFIVILSSIISLLFMNLYKGLLLSTLLVTEQHDVIDSAEKYVRALETGRMKYLVNADVVDNIHDCESCNLIWRVSSLIVMHLSAKWNRILVEEPPASGLVRRMRGAILSGKGIAFAALSDFPNLISNSAGETSALFF